MKIKTKLIILTIFGVFSSITVSVAIASYLIQNQNQNQNEERLTHALASLQSGLVDSVIVLDKNYKTFREGKVWRFFGTLVDTKPSGILSVISDLRAHLTQFGLVNNLDYGFYSGFPASQDKLIFRFTEEKGALLLEDGLMDKSTFGNIEVEPFDEKLRYFPTREEVSEGFGIASLEGVMHITVKDSLIYEGPARDSGVKSGMDLGKFVLAKPFSFDLTKQGEYLGVDINVYDTSGKMIHGAVPLPDLNLETLDSTLQLQTLEDTEGESYDSLLKPILLNDAPIGYISVNISQRLTSEKIWISVKSLALSGIVVLILIGLLSYAIVLQITKPIAAAVKILDQIADVGGDLTQRMDERGNGELAELAKAFNLFTQKVQAIIKEIQDYTDPLASSAEELSSSATLMTQTANGISKAITEENNAIQDGNETTNSMIQSLGEMFDKIKRIQTETDNAKEVAEHGGEVIEKTISTMRNIEDNTRKIEGVVGVITDIANQTNLLSLNAAIEAAKAGSSGKGFAVVAEEVRSLAEKSAQQVVEIRNLVDVSRDSVQNGSKVIEEIQKVFQEIQTGAEQVMVNVSEVTDDMSHQEQAIQEVSGGMKVISQLSSENAASAQELSRTLDETDITTADLSQLAEKIYDTVKVFTV